MDEHEETIEPSEYLRHLRWSLQALAIAGSAQQELFPSHAVKGDELASDYARSSAIVRGQEDVALSEPQAEALDAIDRKLSMMSKDSAEFDLELWTEAAVRTSEHWADIRRLAAAALEAFEWPVEGPLSHSGVNR